MLLAMLSIMPTVAAAAHPARSLVGRWTAPPLLPPLPSFSDGPYAGNGDLGVTLGGPPQRAVQYVALKSFWTGAFFQKGAQQGEGAQGGQASACSGGGACCLRRPWSGTRRR